MALGRRQCQEKKVHSFLMISDFRKSSSSFIGGFSYSARFSYVKNSTENDDEMGNWWKINRRGPKVPGGKHSQLEFLCHKSNMD